MFTIGLNLHCSGVKFSFNESAYCGNGPGFWMRGRGSVREEHREASAFPFRRWDCPGAVARRFTSPFREQPAHEARHARSHVNLRVHKLPPPRPRSPACLENQSNSATHRTMSALQSWHSLLNGRLRPGIVFIKYCPRACSAFSPGLRTKYCLGTVFRVIIQGLT